MSVSRFFLFLFFFALTNKAWAQEQTPLVYIYCDYLTSKEPTLEEGDAWSTLVRHLEARKLIHQKAVISENPKFMECVQKNSPLFESGEFIFEGREQLRSSLGVLKEKVKTPSLIAMEDLSFSDEWVSVVHIRNQEPSEQGGLEADMLDRERRYATLWESFLQSLKEKIEITPSSVSPKTVTP